MSMMEDSRIWIQSMKNIGMSLLITDDYTLNETNRYANN